MLATLLAPPVSLKSVRCEQITLFRYRIPNWLFPGLFTETLLVLTGPFIWSAHRVPVISDMPPYSVSGTATT
mgnify:CR=1 FL=1